MIRIFLLLTMILFSNFSSALDACEDDDGNDKYNILCDRSDILIYNSPECLWEITPLTRPSDKNKTAAFNAFNQLLYDKTPWGEYRLQAWQREGFWHDMWRYEYRDDIGVKSACTSRQPTFNERMYIIRHGDKIDDVYFTVSRGYCAARRVTAFYTTDYAYGYCTWNWDDDGDYPIDDDIGDNRIETFYPNDVSDASNIQNGKSKGLAAWDVCLVRYKNGDTFKHSNVRHSGVHNGLKNKVCAYVIDKVFGNCDKRLFDSWEDSLIGCVDEPPLPGPDVFNSVIASKKAPYVDKERCLESGGQNSIDNKDYNCKTDRQSLIELGSTFDKPVVVVTTGEGNTGANILKLTYQFYARDYNPSKKMCDKFSIAAYSLNEFCAIVPPDQPGKVCACQRDLTIPLNSPVTKDNVNFCGVNPIIGCVDRPTMEHSGLTYIAEPAIYKDPKTNVAYPAGRISIVEADTSGEPKRKSNGDFVRRLPVPEYKTPNLYTTESLIREYYPLTIIPPYTDANYTGSNASCKDSSGRPVYYNTQGNFYLLNSSGKILGNPAGSGVRCSFNNQTLSGNFIKPQGYTRESKKFYGIEFSTLIPKLDGDSNIRFARYTSPGNPPLQQQECTPVRMSGGGMCDFSAIRGFYPGGNRSRTYCPVVKDQTVAPCNSKNPLMGANDSEALKLYCPGVMGTANSDGGSKICVEANSSWRFEKISDYYKAKNGTTNSQFALLDCQNPVSSKHCTSIAGSNVIPAVIATAETGFASFPEGTPNSTQYGTCDARLGYEPRHKWLAAITPSSYKDSICALTHADLGGVAVTGAACDSRYAQQKPEVDAFNIVAEQRTTNTWNTQNRNISYDEFYAVWFVLPMSKWAIPIPELDPGMIYLWYSNPKYPPKRIIDQYGNVSYENPCVLKP